VYQEYILHADARRFTDAERADLSRPKVLPPKGCTEIVQGTCTETVQGADQ